MRDKVNKYYKRHHPGVNTRSVPYQDKLAYYELSTKNKKAALTASERKAKQRAEEQRAIDAITVPWFVAAVHEQEAKTIHRTKDKAMIRMLQGKAERRQREYPALKEEYLISRSSGYRKRGAKTIPYPPEKMTKIGDARQ